MVAVDVSEQRQIAVPVHEYVFAAIVVEVAPYGSHRHSFARTVEIRESCTRRDFLERAVPFVVIESVGLAETAVGEVEIWLSVAIEIGDGDRCSQCRDVWLYVRDLRIERRPVVHEVNAGRRGLVTQQESRMRGV